MNLAIFDLDHTLINCDSDSEWYRFQLDKGLIGAEAAGRHRRFYQDYADGCLDMEAYLEFNLKQLARFSRTELNAMHQEYMQLILPKIMPMARLLVNSHRDAGDTLLLISATNEFIIKPIAFEFGIENVIGICLATDTEGNYTGGYIGTPSFQEGKITRLQQWLSARGATLADYEKTYFYSDSHNDLPLLEQVSHSVAVNPDAVLAEVAAKHGWPVLNFVQA